MRDLVKQGENIDCLPFLEFLSFFGENPVSNRKKKSTKAKIQHPMGKPSFAQIGDQILDEGSYWEDGDNDRESAKEGLQNLYAVFHPWMVDVESQVHEYYHM